MPTRELSEAKARIVTEARAKLDEITDKTTAEQRVAIESEFDRMMADHDKLDERHQREMKLAAAKSKLDAVDLSRRPNMGAGEGRGVDEPEVVEYREAFHSYLRAQGNLSDLSPEVRAALADGYTNLPVEQRAQTTTNAAGGYTVPTELQNILVRSMLAWGPMYSDDLCTVISTTGGNPLPIPTINDTAVTGAAAPAQGTTLTDTGAKDAVFGQSTLGAFSFDTQWVRVSLELANDSIFAMEQLLGDLLGERLGRTLNAQLTTGVGTTAPAGIVTGSSLGKTAASISAITWDEIMDLYHSVDPAYRVSPKARYMFNDSTLQSVRKLKDGQGNYLWQSGDVKGGIPSLFNGSPYSINQAMASMATGNKVMLFGDFSKYYIRKAGAPIIGAIQDKDFWPGFGIAGYVRVDGVLVDTAAVKHLKNA